MTPCRGRALPSRPSFSASRSLPSPERLALRPTSWPGTSRPKEEASNYARYLRTRFLRFLVSLRKHTQHATSGVYAFVPDLPLDQEWTDEKLYKRYGLTEDEIAFIESQVAEHDRDLFDQADSEDDG
jgi:site-specific DNA-methyltransferase (adenine-specific)